MACGYSQIPGVDFQNSYAPTINDISGRLLIILMIMKGYEARLVDVETAFLYGELEEVLSQVLVLAPRQDNSTVPRRIG